ncbi:uncharacterized protein PHACADRAFT_202647 [Phanerochaete carnosa HHB-10118-sp]|uniref:Uncharacterized protein n=1 Tax=Phanerochaete carnosa (strain HHB-10118-sp) TaxID=650164 RepID=K5VPC6_PHACS|nr:uncharacterized protein PHACADRAFT_202647 [Phanerochaete carnosa HHB-10118-sp]EKM48575.1 hypothetical protein PHACADRAFT_202647 [Phanerochaete carnosa HHB-10118-sp]
MNPEDVAERIVTVIEGLNAADTITVWLYREQNRIFNHAMVALDEIAKMNKDGTYEDPWIDVQLDLDNVIEVWTTETKLTWSLYNWTENYLQHDNEIRLFGYGYTFEEHHEFPSRKTELTKDEVEWFKNLWHQHKRFPERVDEERKFLNTRIENFRMMLSTPTRNEALKPLPLLEYDPKTFAKPPTEKEGEELLAQRLVRHTNISKLPAYLPEDSDTDKRVNDADAQGREMCQDERSNAFVGRLR